MSLGERNPQTHSDRKEPHAPAVGSHKGDTPPEQAQQQGPLDVFYLLAWAGIVTLPLVLLIPKVALGKPQRCIEALNYSRTAKPTHSGGVFFATV